MKSVAETIFERIGFVLAQCEDDTSAAEYQEYQDRIEAANDSLPCREKAQDVRSGVSLSDVFSGIFGHAVHTSNKGD